MEHHISYEGRTALFGTTLWFARCSCGWESAPWAAKTGAEAEAKIHVEDSTKRPWPINTPHVTCVICGASIGWENEETKVIVGNAKRHYREHLRVAQSVLEILGRVVA